MIQFENPFAFLLLFIVPFLYFLRWIHFFSRISFPLNLSDWNGENFKWKKNSRKFVSILQKIIVLISFALTVTALSNPVVRRQEKVFSSRGADIMFVLDVSPSMASIDIGKLNRIDAAKNAIKTLAETDEGDALGVIITAKEAALVTPLTLDRPTFFKSLENISVGELGDGTALGTGLSSAIYHLENSSSPHKCIILITDGENNAGSIHPNTAARLASQKNISLYILGVGTKGTVPL
ncbi:MAG: VWA domain-containing protein, partial [Treponema sp.]|nr:VWA domain-containing protein [Treponema sp.]